MRRHNKDAGAGVHVSYRASLVAGILLVACHAPVLKGSPGGSDNPSYTSVWLTGYPNVPFTGSGCDNYPGGGQVCGDMHGGVTINGTNKPFNPGTPTVLYVAVGGSDLGQCTQAAPCATIQRAINLVPKLIQAPTIISVGPGLFSVGAYVNGFTFDMGTYAASADAGPYLAIQGTMLQADAGGAMTGRIANVAPGTGPSRGASGPSAWSTATVTGAGWTTNALAGLQFCITSGPGAPECSVIEKNTATVATMVGVWTIAPPDGGAFEIETWGTFIDGGLNRPPGASGLQGGSSAFPAVFYVDDNNATGYRSGYGAGYTNDLGGQGIFGNASYTEPQISINSFAFLNGDNLIDLGASGPELIDFSRNSVTDGIAALATWGTSLQVVGNYSVQDSFGDQMYQVGNYMLGNVGAISSGFLLGTGNYCSMVSSGGYSVCFLIGAFGYIAQNYMIETDTGFSEYGIEMSGANAAVSSVGNEFSHLSTGFSTIQGATACEMYEDSSDYTLDGQGILALQKQRLYLGGSAPTSTGVQNFILARTGADIRLGGISVLGLGDAGDIQADGTGYSYTYLVNDGGVFVNGSLLSYNNGAIVNLQTGTAVYK